MLITAAVKKVEVSRIQPTCSLRDKMETYCGWKKILHQLVDDLPHCTPIICSVSLWPNSYQLVLDFVHPQYGKLCLISDKSKPTKIECWDLFCKTTGFAHQHVPGGYPRGPGRNNHRLSKKTLSVDWIKFYCEKWVSGSGDQIRIRSKQPAWQSTWDSEVVSPTSVLVTNLHRFTHGVCQ